MAKNVSQSATIPKSNEQKYNSKTNYVKMTRYSSKTQKNRVKITGNPKVQKQSISQNDPKIQVITQQTLSQTTRIQNKQ